MPFLWENNLPCIKQRTRSAEVGKGYPMDPERTAMSPKRATSLWLQIVVVGLCNSGCSQFA